MQKAEVRASDNDSSKPQVCNQHLPAAQTPLDTAITLIAKKRCINTTRSGGKKCDQSQPHTVGINLAREARSQGGKLHAKYLNKNNSFGYEVIIISTYKARLPLPMPNSWLRMAGRICSQAVSRRVSKVLVTLIRPWSTYASTPPPLNNNRTPSPHCVQ